MKPLEKRARSTLPMNVRRALKSPLRELRRRTLAGDRITCPICDGQFRRLLPRDGHPDRQCPSCHSLVRHRAMWLFLRDGLLIEDQRPRILHFAPERGIDARIRATGAEYVTGDIDSSLAAERIDITSIQYPDDSFDLVICSHVLEHVPDDRAAMAEMFRVLRPGGRAVIVVPIKTGRTKDFLDPSPQPAHADGYLRRGSHGHVREIGADYPDRLRAVGFQVEIVDHADAMSAEDRARYAVERGELFYVCTRPAASQRPVEDGVATPV